MVTDAVADDRGRRRILVTGGAGFIGSNLVDTLLAAAEEVDVVDDLSTGSLANLSLARANPWHRLSFHQLNVLDDVAVGFIERRAPDVIVHLAGSSDPHLAAANPVADAELMVLAAVGMLEGARLAGASKVVFVEGADLYGTPPPDGRAWAEDEAETAVPDTAHGVASQAIERYRAWYLARYGLVTTALVVANVYGPRQPACGAYGLVGAAIDATLKGSGLDVVSPDGLVDLVHVADVVEAIQAAIEHGDGLRINVAGDTPVEVDTLLDAIDAAAQAVGASDSTGADSGEDDGGEADGADPVRYSAGVLDATRATLRLGWRPKVSLADGLAELVARAVDGTVDDPRSAVAAALGSGPPSARARGADGEYN